MGLYPVHLQLEGKPALVVGGGPVAAAKASALLEAEARVQIVAPDLSEEMQRLIERCELKVELRAFATSDLDGVWIVVAATDNPEVHQRIFEEAGRRNLLLCVVDDPVRSNFIVPAVLRRGDLVVTVSTSGTAPALAARLRDHLGEIFGEQYSRALEQLKDIRAQLKKQYPNFGERRQAWYRLLDQEVLPALRRGEMPVLKDRISRDLKSEAHR